jgi:glycosyltransferase involved in cell wall biosynthesis
MSAQQQVGVTTMIFTLDEAVNLPHCLESLAWCDDVIVVDSFSTDDTEVIARRHGARFYQHAFTGFGDQRNWAFEHTAPRHPWVLVLDADERVPPELAREIAERTANAPSNAAAFRLRRRFHMWGRWLRYSSLYPTWVVRLVRHDRVRYENRGHAETQVVDGDTLALEHDLIDENHKGVDDWFERQFRYARQDARHEIAMEGGNLTVAKLLASDPLQRRSALKALAHKMPARPTVYFLYSYLLRGGFLDGRQGFEFCRMRALYQQLVVTEKYELKSVTRTTAQTPGPRNRTDR